MQLSTGWPMKSWDWYSRSTLADSQCYYSTAVEESWFQYDHLSIFFDSCLYSLVNFDAVYTKAHTLLSSLDFRTFNELNEKERNRPEELTYSYVVPKTTHSISLSPCMLGAVALLTSWVRRRQSLVAQSSRWHTARLLSGAVVVSPLRPWGGHDASRLSFIGHPLFLRSNQSPSENATTILSCPCGRRSQ
jgi:hypothetical protein